MSRARRIALGLVPVLGLIVVGRVFVPAAPRDVPVAAGVRLWTGAYHIHTTQSDGSGTAAEVAADAAAAGRDFVIITDHGDGAADRLPPAYMSGVLVVHGVEVSTADGHYVALDLPEAPYPLAGEARDVAEDVQRLGGIGIVAHPDSTRPALGWHDPDTLGDGLEVLNADSAWRDEPALGLARRLLSYPWRPASVLATTLSYPAELLATLDGRETAAPALAMAGVDAHARIGVRPGDEPSLSTRTVATIPGYATSFGTFGMVMPWTDGQAPSGEPSADARAVFDALRRGAMHVAVFALADAGPLSLRAHADGRVYDAGARVEHGPAITLEVRGPDVEGVRLRLLRDGRPWREQAGRAMSVPLPPDAAPGTYRAEVWLPHRWQQPQLPWMLSQAIVIAAPGSADALADAPDAATPLPADTVGRAVDGAWHTEHDPGSTVTVSTGSEGRADVQVALRAGGRVSQFGAAVLDWPSDAPAASEIRFTGSSGRPMRVSVQARVPGDGDGQRWIRSVYLDEQPREVRIALRDMRPVPPARGLVPTDRLHALLFVVDTVNARPGDVRRFTIDGLRLH